MLRAKVSSCRIAWNKKDLDYLRDALQTLENLHHHWRAAFASFQRLVKAPFYGATPMERRRYEVEHFNWLSVEIKAWHSLLPEIRRFAKRKDPKSILRVQKLLRLIADLHGEIEKLGRAANAVLDAQLMEYYHYHPPQVAETA
jgi:hypothetical protein